MEEQRQRQEEEVRRATQPADVPFSADAAQTGGYCIQQCFSRLLLCMDGALVKLFLSRNTTYHSLTISHAGTAVQESSTLAQAGTAELPFNPVRKRL